MNRDFDEIYRRLDAIERHLGMRDRDGHHDDHHHHHDDHHHDHRHYDDRRHDGRDGPDEKRIVDLVVSLVGERVEEVLRKVLDERNRPPEQR